jgi:heme A synthase
MLARLISYALVGTTFLLILLGGVVHTQGASLACPDWPLCYGMVFPPMEGDILLEHGHRLLASAVGAMSVALAMATFPLGGAIRRWALLGVALVIGQGVLGGLTVLYRLPPPISIAHLSTSMLFFAWAVRMSWMLSPARITPVWPAPALLAARPALLWATGLLFGQMVLGAAVRHTHASLSCGLTAWGCNDGYWPVTGPQWLQTSHRLWALAVMGAIVWASLPVLKHARRIDSPNLRRLALGPHILVLLQLAMGVLTLTTGVQLHVVVTHLALGALLWGNMVLLVLRTSRYRRQAASTPATPTGFVPGQA